jgi:hypothetical protein
MSAAVKEMSLFEQMAGVPSTPAQYGCLKLYDEPEQLEADYPDPAPRGRSVAVASLKWPKGAEIGRLVLTSYLRRPEDVAAFQHPDIPGRWLTLELI